MRKRTFIIGLVCWLGIFALGVQWIFNPFGVKFNLGVLIKAVINELKRDPVETSASTSSGGDLMCYCPEPQVINFGDEFGFGFLPGFDLESTRRQFPLHLARLENSGIRDHADRIANESTDEVTAFDYWEWAFRESCCRFAVFMFIWGGSGWLIQWLATRIVRGPGRLVR